MNPRTIMTLALRLIGFWILFHSIGAMVNLVAFINWSSAPGIQGDSNSVIAAGFGVLLHASAAAVLLLFAAPIASLFPDVPNSAGVSELITIRDIYLVAVRILGIYALLSAAPAAQQLVKSMLDYKRPHGLAAEIAWASLLEVCLYAGGGALLISGASAIANVFSKAHGSADRRHGGLPT